jgi:AraC family transcriptional regulator
MARIARHHSRKGFRSDELPSASFVAESDKAWSLRERRLACSTPKAKSHVRAQGSILPRFSNGVATPASAIDALKAAVGLPPGTRASFAWGRCVRGTYAPSDQAGEITKSRSFTKPSRVLARFSLDGGNSTASNTNRLLRGFSFRLGSDGQRSDANPGTIFVLPRGTVDEIRWKGSARRLTAAIGRNLLVNAMDETGNGRDVELTENWNLTDPNIMAVLAAMMTDLGAGSPAGKLYGESLANSLAVYPLNRYGVRQSAPVGYRSGLPACRLNRVLDYIGDNISSDLSLCELASIAGMSSHRFIEMFRRSTGQAPYRYILLQRIERAKENLRDPKASVFEAGMDAGFQNASHFARVFRRFVGTTPSQFRSVI